MLIDVSWMTKMTLMMTMMMMMMVMKYGVNFPRDLQNLGANDFQAKHVIVKIVRVLVY